MSNILVGRYAKSFLPSPNNFYYFEGFHVLCDRKLYSYVNRILLL